MKRFSVRFRAVSLTIALAIVGCGDSPFQVIEELTFDPSLGIDLAAMERLPSGVYRQDILVGTGLEVVDASVPTVFFEGWLANGTKFGEGSFAFVVGTGSVIPGFELGVFGMRVGGVRRIIIPPALGYADQEQEAIPAGSVLIFEVTLDSLEEGGEPGTTPQVVGTGG